MCPELEIRDSTDENTAKKETRKRNASLRWIEVRNVF